MAMIEFFIPAPREYSYGFRGSKAIMDAWRRAAERETMSRDKVLGPCRMIANFILPDSRFSHEDSFGLDLLLLFSPIYEVLRRTVLRRSKQEESWMDRIVINKVNCAQGTGSGVNIQIDWDETAQCSEAENADHRFANTSPRDPV